MALPLYQAGPSKKGPAKPAGKVRIIKVHKTKKSKTK
jgi:hypothetical protein